MLNGLFAPLVTHTLMSPCTTILSHSVVVSLFKQLSVDFGFILCNIVRKKFLKFDNYLCESIIPIQF